MTIDPRRKGLSPQANAHLMRWLTAVQLQAQRICEPSPFAIPVGKTPSTLGSGLAQEADTFLFASALRDFLRAADLISWSVAGTPAASPVDTALNAFRDAVPNLTNIRDVLEHFDAYEKGRGNLQRDAVKRGKDVWSTSIWVDTQDDRVLLFVAPGDAQHWRLDVQEATAAGTLYEAISAVLTKSSSTEGPVD